jgi:hypothetical protein
MKTIFGFAGKGGAARSGSAKNRAEQASKQIKERNDLMSSFREERMSGWR